MSDYRSIPSRDGKRVVRLRLLPSVLLAMAMPACAIDITVDVLNDPAPDGCTAGSCSLREAITLANLLSGPDRILLPATPGVPLQLAIPGNNENGNATGDLDVLDDLEIVGTGAATTTLVQTATDRVLQTTMAADKRLVLRGLTIQGGSAASGGAVESRSLLTIEDAAFVGNRADVEGGAITYTGEIAPSITERRLVLRRVRFENNTAMQQNGSAVGGAIFASSRVFAPFVLIEDCQFIGNEANGSGGAISMNGLPFVAGGTVTILRSRFEGNRSKGGRGGAAIYASDSSFALRVEDGLFDDNVTTTIESFAGGAITLGLVSSAVFLRSTFSSNSGPSGGAINSFSKLDVLDCHFTNNTAAFAGGALHVSNESLVDRTTFQSNHVSTIDSVDGGGGAIASDGLQNLDVFRSTFSGNDAFRGGALALVRTTRLRMFGNTIVAPTRGITGRQATAVRIVDDEFAHSLVFDNNIIIGSCTYPSAARKPNAARGNIEAPGSTCRFDLATSSAQNQISATVAQINLGSPADNGGPTLTRLPGFGSIAINQGSELMCLASDQRRYVRNDAFCDVGSVEVGAIDDTIFSSGFDSP